MRKFIAILMIISTITVYSENVTPEPYIEEEFPQILHDVRRSSIIFCGAYPLGYIYSSLIWDQVFLESDLYSDLDEDEQSNKEIETKLISALIFSGIVVIIDLIIEKVFRGS